MVIRTVVHNSTTGVDFTGFVLPLTTSDNYGQIASPVLPFTLFLCTIVPQTIEWDYIVELTQYHKSSIITYTI